MASLTSRPDLDRNQLARSKRLVRKVRDKELFVVVF